MRSHLKYKPGPYAKSITGKEALPTLPEDRVRRLSKLNYYFTILPKKTVGTIFTVCVAGADSLRIWEKVNSLARIDMHRKHPNK